MHKMNVNIWTRSVRMCLRARDDIPAFGLKHRLSSFLTITVLYHLLCLHVLQISHRRETQIAG